ANASHSVARHPCHHPPPLVVARHFAVVGSLEPAPFTAAEHCQRGDATGEAKARWRSQAPT
ncbi:MAG TPA: hypothetical protein VGL46_19380, partial [Pseudonocardiaceae bacterium]